MHERIRKLWLGIAACIATALPATALLAQEIIAAGDEALSGVAPGSQIQSLAGPAVRMMLSLIAVLAVLGGCLWLLRRFKGGAMQGGLIQIVGGLSLGPKERVVLLRVGEEEILVGVSPTGMRSLHVLEKPSGANRFSLTMEDQR